MCVRVRAKFKTDRGPSILSYGWKDECEKISTPPFRISAHVPGFISLLSGFFIPAIQPKNTNLFVTYEGLECHRYITHKTHHTYTQKGKLLIH